MVTVDLVNEAISGIVSRFEDGDYVRRTYHEVVQENDEVGPEEIHFFIEDEIDTLLTGLNIKNDVRLIDMYRAVDFDVYVLAIAFVIDDELHTIDYVVEGSNY